MEICLIGDEGVGTKSLLQAAVDLNIWRDEEDSHMLSDDDTFHGIPVMLKKWINSSTGEEVLCRVADISGQINTVFRFVPHVNCGRLVLLPCN